MYSAVVSLGSCMRVSRVSNPSSPYWSADGSGGRALLKADQIEAIKEKYYSEDIYRSFFRYADDLLFTGVGFGWDVCPKCGTMVGASGGNKKRHTGLRCGDVIGFKQRECDGILRPLQWDDLKASV